MHTCSRSSFTVRLHLSRKWWSGRTSSNRTTGHNLSSEHTLSRQRLRMRQRMRCMQLTHVQHACMQLACVSYLSCIPAQSSQQEVLSRTYCCAAASADATYCCAAPHLLHLLLCSSAPPAPAAVQLRLPIPPSSLIPTVRIRQHSSAYASSCACHRTICSNPNSPHIYFDYAGSPYAGAP
jgi:hypothetical protein